MRATLLLGLIAFPQAPPTLADYLKAHPGEAALAVGAETAGATGTGEGLGRYGRKAAVLGTVRAIVPTTMVRFDESLSKPPNLYDGLPRDAKVLYLMTLLGPGDWRKAAGAGIGLGDLRGEARDVMASLLPNNPTWRRVRVNDKHGFGDNAGVATLDEKASAEMRLRIERSLFFQQPFEGERGYTGVSIEDEAGKPGETVVQRDREQESGAFGVEVRATVPNAPKKGALDTSVLNATVVLPERTTVADALARIGTATGREILADARVRAQSATFPGGKARAGDLLDALALAVAGSYRKVDSAYLLAANVEGTAARNLRLVLWQEGIEVELRRRKAEWRAKLAASGLAAATDFPANGVGAPTLSVRDRLDRHARDPGAPEFFSTEELSSEQRAFLDRVNGRRKNATVLRDRIGVSSSLRYRFVLPDGTAMQLEGDLGEDREFVPQAPYRRMGADPAIPMAANAAGAARPLVVRLATPKEARSAAETAKAFGFTELWVETERPEALAEAIKGGLPTRLFARPWALAAPRADSDKTLLGETGHVVATRQATAPAWTGYVADRRMESWPRLRPNLADGDLMSPHDPQWPARRNAITALARTKGLAGVVLTETMPHGYEAEENNSHYGSYRQSLVETWSFGYDERTRLAFLRGTGYDPIDLLGDEIYFDVDMDTPTFPRYPRGMLLPREAFLAWTAFRAKANVAASMELRRALGSVPVMVDVRRAFLSQPVLGDVALVPWPLGTEPPSYDDPFVDPREGEIYVVSAPDPRRADALIDFGNAAKLFAPEAKPHAFDLTHVPPSRWNGLLAGWLKRR